LSWLVGVFVVPVFPLFHWWAFRPACFVMRLLLQAMNSSRPTGSVGSCTEPPRLSLTCRAVSSSAMARASGRERASRSSLVTTRVSPGRQAARA